MVSVFLNGIRFLSIISAVIFTCFGCTAEKTTDLPVFTVNKYPVGTDEFTWFMQQEKAAVFEIVNKTCPADSGRNFWIQNCNGTTPKEILHKKTVEKIVRQKVQQELFKELGLIKDIRYTVFLEDLEKLNQERKQAVEQGKVVYGPIQYTQLQYYGHWMTTMQTRAKDKLRKEQLNITETKIREYYSRNKNQFKTAGYLTLDTLVLRSEQTSESSNKLEALANEIVLKVQSGLTLESAVGAYTDRKDFAIAHRKYEQVQDDRLGELFPDSGHFKAIRALNPGRTVRFRASENEVWIVQCISVTASHDLPYEQIQGILADRYVDLEYERMVDTRVQNARIEVNQEVLDKIDIQ
jgi:hypothetical protein